jgi:glutamyl-tRNA synthetase
MSDSNKVKTPRYRAAPSPTGKVHIGTVRAYLPNFLLARKYGGKNILRVEDTDAKRNALNTVDDAVDAMIEAYEAVGITFDEGPHVGGDYGPYVQSQRLDIYKKYSEQLIDQGSAYYCFCSKERLDEVRQEQKNKKQKPMYDGCCRDINVDTARERVESGEEYVVRMKFPKDGVTICKDEIYGEVKFKNSDIEDQVLLKQDGFPTYHLAVVVDDHLMEITTCIRGDDWLPSFPKHVKLYEYFGWDMPKFAHLPMILNPDGRKKLSKRFGANSIVAKLREGYLGEAVINYAMLCGWAPKEEEANTDEIYTVDELIQLFELSRVNKTPARYDQKKFDYINAKHIRRMDLETFAQRVIDWAENIVLKDFKIDTISGLEEWELELRETLNKYLPLWKSDNEKFKKGLALEQERIRNLSELPKSLAFFFDQSLNWTDEDWKLAKRSKEEIANALELVLPRLDEVFADGQFDHVKWEDVVRSTADEFEWGHGELFMSLRSATTGSLQSPPLLESFEVMGWDKAHKFIEDSVIWLRSN